LEEKKKWFAKTKDSISALLMARGEQVSIVLLLARRAIGELSALVRIW
jgi:hypothetical protein